MPTIKAALEQMEPLDFARFYNYHFAGENRMIKPTKNGWEEIPDSGGDESGGRFVKTMTRLMQRNARLVLKPNANGDLLIDTEER